jgi:uncharacterized membrane-anchored protein
MSGQGQYYQQPPPQQYHQQPVYQQKQGIESIFVAKDKLGLFMILCGALFFIGMMLLDLMASYLVDGEEVIYFLAYLMVDLGIIGMIILLLVGGIYREDMPEKVRTRMILVAGFIIIMFVIVYLSRGTMSLFG